MKISLTFTIYNKEKWVKSLLKSWIDNLSNKNDYEIIIVFDDLKDNSKKIAKKYLDSKPYKYNFYEADDKYEIYCNNLALEKSEGDYIVFIQDDNWIEEENWDYTLTSAIKGINNLGAIGLLAGVKLLPNNKFQDKNIFSFLDRKKPRISYKRVEFDSNNKNKKEIWQVDGVNRPFAIRTSLLREIGGLDKEYMPTCGDDLDLSIKLLLKGKKNIYIPFNIKNLSASRSTMGEVFIKDVYENAYRILSKRYSNLLNQLTKKNNRIKKLKSIEIH